MNDVVAQGRSAVHGCFVDTNTGMILGLDGETGRCVSLREDVFLPVAFPAAKRLAVDLLEQRHAASTDYEQEDRPLIFIAPATARRRS